MNMNDELLKHIKKTEITACTFYQNDVLYVVVNIAANQRKGLKILLVFPAVAAHHSLQLAPPTKNWGSSLCDLTADGNPSYALVATPSARLWLRPLRLP